MAIRLPAKLAERGLNKDHARAINQLAENQRRMRLVARPGQRVETSANGTTLDPGTSATQAQGDDLFFY